ncbi:hypothetical protein ABKN59_011116 [Abortiporus biennis]
MIYPYGTSLRGGTDIHRIVSYLATLIARETGAYLFSISGFIARLVETTLFRDVSCIMFEMTTALVCGLDTWTRGYRITSTTIVSNPQFYQDVFLSLHDRAQRLWRWNHIGDSKDDINDSHGLSVYRSLFRKVCLQVCSCVDPSGVTLCESQWSFSYIRSFPFQPSEETWALKSSQSPPDMLHDVRNPWRARCYLLFFCRPDKIYSSFKCLSYNMISNTNTKLKMA